jgi:hypothetical protein
VVPKRTIPPGGSIQSACEENNEGSARGDEDVGQQSYQFFFKTNDIPSKHYRHNRRGGYEKNISQYQS